MNFVFSLGTIWYKQRLKCNKHKDRVMESAIYDKSDPDNYKLQP